MSAPQDKMLVVPAGLDGYPDPIRTPERDAVLACVGEVVDRIAKPRVLVAIDGASGVGKSTFADELSGWLATRHRSVVRSTTDSFHRPRADRYRRGPTSPEGYYLDSHDLETIERELLGAFKAGAPRVQVASFDEPTDAPAVSYAEVEQRAVLVFDGLFLLRAELRPHWDLTVYLKAQQRRDTAWNSYLHTGLPDDETARSEEILRRLEQARWPRYHQGWRLYVEDADPERAADVVIDNDNLANPHLVRTFP